MRALVWFIALWIGAAPAFADSSFVAPTANGTAAVGQLPGTTTNDSATAGNIGEYVAAGSINNNLTVTITIAAPAVVTWTAHNIPVPATAIKAATAVVFTTSGALPTGIAASTVYYAVPIDANTFNIATSVANAMAGTFVTTTGSQSGTQTGSFSVSLTSNTPADMAALGLTAGNWEITCSVYYLAGATTTVTTLQTTIGTVAVTANRTADTLGVIVFNGLVISSSEFWKISAGPSNQKLTSTTTYFCNTAATVFGISTMIARTFMRAIRVR